jgi:hypothetical protein
MDWKKLGSIGLQIAGLIFPIISQVEGLSQILKDKGTPWSSAQKEDEAVARFKALLVIGEGIAQRNLLNDPAFETLVRQAIRSIVQIQNAVKAAKALDDAENPAASIGIPSVAPTS